MNDIICPNCKKTFKVDEAGFADILKQVRDHQFDEELHKRLELAEKDKESAVKLAEANIKNEFQANLAAKDKELAELKAEKEKELVELLAKKESEIADMKTRIDKAEVEKTLSINEAVKNIEKERDEFKARLDTAEIGKELAVTKAVNVVQKERDELKIKLTSQENEKLLIKKDYETQIKDRDDAIERLKEMRAKLSTKMIGESLEQHCQNEFNKIRAAAFPNAYFEKDNDSSSGSKGDYVFRDPADGVESVSIMFDMKNENDTTEAKKKNEDFLAKLDKDRNEKGCEYAILVSMLEAENDFYNQGIADMSFRYPKMYVIRPQFFIPIISILKNTAEKSLAVKNELAIIKSQNIDITTFEDNVNNWKTSWLNSIRNAGNKHVEAVEQINKAIKDLEKVRDALAMSDKHLLAAENKMDDLTIKRLTRGNPTMIAKFAELSDTKTTIEK